MNENVLFFHACVQSFFWKHVICKWPIAYTYVNECEYITFWSLFWMIILFIVHDLTLQKEQPKSEYVLKI